MPRRTTLYALPIDNIDHLGHVLNKTYSFHRDLLIYFGEYAEEYQRIEDEEPAEDQDGLKAAALTNFLKQKALADYLLDRDWAELRNI